jgi:hypothetical protein
LQPETNGKVMNQVKSNFAKIVSAFTLLFLLQGVGAHAQSILQLDLHKPGTQIALLKVEGLSAAEPVTIRIKNVEGVTVFKDRSSEKQYGKQIDFEKLRRGIYLVDLEQASGVSRKVVVKDEKGLSIQDGGFYFHNSIKLLEADKKLLVRFNSNLDQEVTIRIADARGNIVHEESNIKTDAYANRFNLSGLQHGTYKVSLISGGYSSTKAIRI